MKRLVALAPCVALIFAACAHSPPRFDPRARRTCLVLSVGGPAGVAHIGALQSTKAAGIVPACVAGTSMGALLGALYVTGPDEDPDARFRRLVAAYKSETLSDAGKRGLGVGLLFGALAKMAEKVTGDTHIPPMVAAAGGFVVGAVASPLMDRDRLVRVLDGFWAGARIESLHVPYVTFFQQGTNTGVRMMTARTGNLAEAVGGSVANPLIFPRMTVEKGQPLDPGADRVSATPIDDACRLFPDANLLAINVSGQPSYRGADMKCPLREVRIDPPELTPEDVFAFGPGYEQAVTLGRVATAAALK